MARTHADMMAALPPERQARIRARAAEMIAEVESLQAVRKLANLSQAQLAAQLGVKQPTVHKMETQADFYVSTLERFVEAAGGTVEIRVTLPGHSPLKLKRFSDLGAHSDT
jgi:transcriptional regulator with XRE-family HTH domain